MSTNPQNSPTDTPTLSHPHNTPTHSLPTTTPCPPSPIPPATISIPKLSSLLTFSFCFKYIINLGDDRFGSMTINQKTNLYQEAEMFCKRYGLESYVAVLLEREMFEEVLRVKEAIIDNSYRVGNRHNPCIKLNTTNTPTQPLTQQNQPTQIGKIRTNSTQKPHEKSQPLIVKNSSRTHTCNQQDPAQIIKLNKGKAGSCMKNSSVLTQRKINQNLIVQDMERQDVYKTMRSKDRGGSGKNCWVDNGRSGPSRDVSREKGSKINLTINLSNKKSLNKNTSTTIRNLNKSKSKQKIKCQYKQNLNRTIQNNSHFQQMYKRHQQLQKKKQLSRKASMQKIPFKPTINTLSRKIVDLKRNSLKPNYTQISQLPSNGNNSYNKIMMKVQSKNTAIFSNNTESQQKTIITNMNSQPNQTNSLEYRQGLIRSNCQGVKI